MHFGKKTIKDIPLDHKTVLVRVEYNVPLDDRGRIADDYRMQQSLPTLRYLMQAGCKIILIAHLGKPDGKVDPKLSLEPVAVHLGELLKEPVGFVPDCIGDRVKVAAKHLRSGGILLLENLRFHQEEEANDAAFAKRLAQDTGAEYFVQDAFGAVHRDHASTDAITHFLPSVAGLLVQKEVTTITKIMAEPKRPLVVVLGGAKVSDKITVIEAFIKLADQIIIGGAMANTFLKYKGVDIGKSKAEDDQDHVLERIYAAARKKVGDNVDDFLLLPVDVAVAPEVNASQRRQIVDINHITPDEYILDMGPRSTDAMLAHLKQAGSVIWNGTLGIAELPPFAMASAKLAHALAAQQHHTFSVIGGGDTADFVLHWDPQKGKSFGLVSTGGGASLELMAGDTLPGVASLLDQ